MLISCSWLEAILGTALDHEQVAAVLTSLGLEVEGMERHTLDGVIVGELHRVAKHPDAERLSVTEVFDGTTTHTVVCGATNLPPPGGKIAFAPVGTVLPGDFHIGAREIRGQASSGMICSEAEMQIGSDGDGILVLPEDWVPGTALVDLVPGIIDTVIEISVTPNRPDALGHLGVARDLALALKLSPGFSLPPVEFDAGGRDSERGLVSLGAPDRCGRYFGFALEGAKVGLSPLWMRTRLHRVGLRPINDVVDITNFVLMESGQPLHAFDRDRLDEARVVVRMAQTGERLTTLDETEIELTADDLVIADASAPQALAGVMGGADSMVGEETRRLLLEAAWFDPRGVRRSARAHGFHTDSSHRFERGVDYGRVLEWAARRAARLLCELTGATCAGWSEAVGQRPQVPSIGLRPQRISALLGMQIDPVESRAILEGLEVRVALGATAKDPWQCVPPTHRPDLGIEEDLIEEVMRHHGLENLPATPCVASAAFARIQGDPRFRERVPVMARLADAMRNRGLHEHLSLAFANVEELTRFDPQAPAHAVHLQNPMKETASVLRTHLGPGLIRALRHNLSHHGRAVGLFEMGRVYAWPVNPRTVDILSPSEKGRPTADVDSELPDERERVAMVRTLAPNEIRGTVAMLLDALLAAGIEVRSRPPRASLSYLHPGVQTGIWMGEVCVGCVGELHPDLRDEFDLRGHTVAYAEVWVDRLQLPKPARYTPVARFPASSRDLSLDLSVTVAASRVIDELVAAAGASGPPSSADSVRLAAGDASRDPIELIEDYRGRGISEGRRALLVRLHYRASERSVTDDEVQSLHDGIVDRACTALRRIDAKVQIR